MIEASQTSPVAWLQACVAWVRSPVHTAAAGRLVAGFTPFVPMATQVVVVQESPVMDEEPVGNVDSSDHALDPEAYPRTGRMYFDIDTLKFSGPAFEKVDNRLMSLQLVELGFTDATMFTAQGEVVQPAEAAGVVVVPWPTVSVSWAVEVLTFASTRSG